MTYKVEGNICGLSSKENLPGSSNKCCPDMLDDTEHREESLWSLFHKLKAVLENPPAVERKTHPGKYYMVTGKQSGREL